MEENMFDIFYHHWVGLSEGQLRGLRYNLGIQLRSTYPRPAFPDYLYSQVAVVNRILDGRLVVS